MKIKILGSGGGEGFPCEFCGCDHCEAARRAGGKSLRSLSQTLVNDDLLVDLPCDTASHARTYGINLGSVADLLVTHVHHDHFQPSILCDRGHCFAHNIKSPTLTVHGSEDVPRVLNAVDAIYPIHPEIKKNITVKPFVAFEERKVGNYFVTALPAKHAPSLIPFNYLIREGDKTLLYLHDTGYPDEPIFAHLTSHGVVADAVLMDATMGVLLVSDTSGHMCFEQNKRLKKELIHRGIATDKTVFVANHITHNQSETHDKIEQIFENTNILVAYDGMEIEV